MELTNTDRLQWGKCPKFILLAMFFFYVLRVAGQKPSLELTTYKSWPQVAEKYISNDGKFAVYALRSGDGFNHLVLQATDGSWKREIPGGTDAAITADSRSAVLRLPNDTLGIFSLGGRGPGAVLIPGIASYKLSSFFTDQCLAYVSDKAPGELTVMNLRRGILTTFASVYDYVFSNRANVLLVESKLVKDSGSAYVLLQMDLINGNIDTLFTSRYPASRFFFGPSGKIAWLLSTINGQHISNQLMCYDMEKRAAFSLVTDSSQGMPDNVYISSEDNLFGFPKFSVDGKFVFFFIKRNGPIANPLGTVSPENPQVWSYADAMLPTETTIKSKNGEGAGRVAACRTELGSKVVVLGKDGDADLQICGRNMDHMLVGHSVGNVNEAYWRKASEVKYCLVSTGDGSRSIIGGTGSKKQVSLSSSGKYVIWYDSQQRTFFTYNTISGVVSNVTGSVPFPVYNDESDIPAKPSAFGVAAWQEGDSNVYIYDRYDIWQIDPDGRRAATCLTGGYGRKHQLILRYLDLASYDIARVSTVKSGDIILLSARNLYNKYSGYFQIIIAAHARPVQLSMLPENPAFPMKAKSAQMYLVTRMTATEYPNIFSTIDFVHFVKLSVLSPQSAFNWYTAEQWHWRMPNGTIGQGILYKPENFDSSKKYPVLFTYYESEAEDVYDFLLPEPSNGALNIPWFVSHGYIVCEPDIHFKVGYPGQSAFNSVVSAAKALAEMPWVDRGRMGLHGHSFGGYETNYLVTQTNLFVAASSASGFTDIVSKTFDLRYGRGESGEYVTENDQTRIGKTLWQDPRLYIENSPIFYADKVFTPLLVLANRNDGSVPWSQGVEWFNALRRLGKKVWMLDYVGEGHTLQREEDQLDYSKRLADFFDHYLMGSPMPGWMRMSGGK